MTEPLAIIAIITSEAQALRKKTSLINDEIR